MKIVSQSSFRPEVEIVEDRERITLLWSSDSRSNFYTKNTIKALMAPELFVKDSSQAFISTSSKFYRALKTLIPSVSADIQGVFYAHKVLNKAKSLLKNVL